MQVRKVVIIGGGIGGLTAAIALKRLGIEVKVFERAAEIREVGAGLTLWSNGMTAFRSIGLDQSMLQAGAEVDTFWFRNSQAKLLGCFDMKALSAKIGSPSVSIYRKDLLHELFSQVDEAEIVTNAQATGFVQDGTTVAAQFANHQAEEADLLIGSDGLHSVIRGQLFGDQAPLKYAGYTCWRGMAKFTSGSFPRGHLIATVGPGSQTGILDVGRGRVAWYATKNRPASSLPKNGHEMKAELREIFQSWHSPIPEAIEATAADDILRNDIYDRDPIRSFSRGRVLLLGDAAHPTTPNLGQGACMAIEDGVEIARALQRHDFLEQAIKWYEMERIGRTALVTRRSRLAGDMAQWESPFKCKVRDALFKLEFRSGYPPGFKSLLSYAPPN